jgi:hypothetical protein
MIEELDTRNNTNDKATIDTRDSILSVTRAKNQLENQRRGSACESACVMHLEGGGGLS